MTKLIWWSLAVLLVGCGSSAERTWTGDAGQRPDTVRPDAGRPDTADLRPSGWRLMAAAPLQGRSGHSATWTGRELIVWGGRHGYFGAPHADGASYNPSQDSWRPLPPSPLTGRSEHVAVWTGTELVLWGGKGTIHFDDVQKKYVTEYLQDAASFDPVRGQWKALGTFAHPNSQAALGVLLDGGEILVVGGRGEFGSAGSSALVLNPSKASSRTLALPTAFSAGPVVAATRVGKAVLLVLNDSSLSTEVKAYELDPATGAVVLRPDKLQLHKTPEQKVTGVSTGPRSAAFVNFYGDCDGVVSPDLAIFDVGTGFSTPRARPGMLSDGRLEAVVVAGDRRLFLWGGVSFSNCKKDWVWHADGATYDLDSGSWTAVSQAPIAARTEAAAAWTGRDFIVWGGEVSGDPYYVNDGAIYRP